MSEAAAAWKHAPGPPHGPRRSGRAIAACLAVTAALTVLDLWSKDAVEASLSRAPSYAPPAVCAVDEESGHILGPQRIATAPHVIVPGYLELRYAENCGAAFGFMRGQPEWLRRSVFVAAAVIAVIALLWMFREGRGLALFAAGVPLIVSGAIGNLVDRVRYGYVVDFIRFHWGEAWDYPTFNVADIGITVGVIFLVIDGFLEGRAEKQRIGASSAKPAGS